MSIATQVKRLQDVRNQIRAKMVALGLSKNTDLLQKLANDLDGVNKISPTNNGTTDPGTDYTNVDTLSRSTSTRYIKVPKGYNDANRKFTVSGVANGAYSASVASHDITNATASSSVTGSVTGITTTTKPSGTDGTDYYTITPKLTTAAGSSKATGKATIGTAGYLVTGNTTSGESSKTVGVTASQGGDYYLKAGKSSDVTATVTASVSNITSINASQVTNGVTVTASASGSTVVPVGYYSAQVSKTPSNSKSTTIKPKLAGTDGSIELTAGTSAFTKTSTADYSNGFITSVKVNPTPSSAKEFTPTIAGGTVSPDTGKLLSSVTVKGVPSFSITLFSDSWSSDNNAAIGKYYYNVDNTRITADNNLYVAPISASASQSQSFGVYAYSQSKASGASRGTLQFRAMIQPTSNLTYAIYCLS